MKDWITETETEGHRRYLRVSRRVRDVNAPRQAVLTGRVRAPRGLTGIARLALLWALKVHERLEQTFGSTVAHSTRSAAWFGIGVGPPPGPGVQPVAGITPKPPTPSLLTVARTLPAGVNWHSGISWRSATCAPGYRYRYCGDGEKEEPNRISKPQFFPYAIYVPYACDWVRPDNTNEYGYTDDAKAQLDAVTPWHMSRELWTGETDFYNPSLRSAAVDLSADAPVHPVTALGALLEAYFDCPADADDDNDTDLGSGSGTPIVHVPYSALISLIANHVVNQQGDYYVGPNCFVSPGPGYPTGRDAAPANANEGEGEPDAWMYISGSIEYALGDITVLDDDFDHRTNRYVAYPERWVIHRFDPCCVFAIGAYVPSPSDSVNV